MTDLGERLEALAQRLDLTTSVDVARIVGTRAVVERRSRPRVRWRWALVPVAAMTAVVAVPGSRHTLARWLGLTSTRIEPPPTPTTAPAVVTSQPVPAGSVVTVPATITATAAPPATFPASSAAGTIDIGAAEREVGLPAPVPTLLGAPQRVSVVHPPQAGQIVLVYAPGPLLPESPIPDVGALVSVFRADLGGGIFRKVLDPATTVEEVQIDGTTGYWLSGAPHTYAYATPDGQFVVDTLRLATNTLLWELNGVTYRIEAAIDKTTALRIASTIDVS